MNVEFEKELAVVLEKCLELAGEQPASALQDRLLEEVAILDHLHARQQSLISAAEEIIQVGYLFVNL